MDRIADDELLRWLREDAPHGDLTSRALVIGARPERLPGTWALMIGGLALFAWRRPDRAVRPTPP